MEKRNKSENHQMRQNQRFAICVALADLFQEHLGPDTEIPEPYLENGEDEKSDLILELDFGPDFKGEARLPYEGELSILKNEALQKLFVVSHNRFKQLLEETPMDSADVIIEGV